MATRCKERTPEEDQAYADALASGWTPGNVDSDEIAYDVTPTDQVSRLEDGRVVFIAKPLSPRPLKELPLAE